MTMYPTPLCQGCVHLQDATQRTCAAFPHGIPDAIWHSKADHRLPYDSDQDIQFAPQDAAATVYAARLFPAERMQQTVHEHQFVAERCLVCGCGEPEVSHGRDVPTMQRDPALRLSVASCPECGRTVSEPDGAWYVGMTCPDCGHRFTAQDETAPVLDELRAFRADVLRLAKREY